MRQWCISGLAAMLCCYTVGVATARANVTDAQVTAAIKGGVQYLYSVQKAWGNWESQATLPKDLQAGGVTGSIQFGGRTALILDALLSTGEEYQGNPKLKRALMRSEERRGGKDGRSRWAPEH